MKTIEPAKKALLEKRVTNRLKRFKLGPAARQRAVRHILHGVEFCVKEGLDVTASQRPGFDIASTDRCILGFNCGDFTQGRRKFKLRLRRAARMGFCRLSEDKKLMSLTRWGQIYNGGWKAAGAFFSSN